MKDNMWVGMAALSFFLAGGSLFVGFMFGNKAALGIPILTVVMAVFGWWVLK